MIVASIAVGLSFASKTMILNISWNEKKNWRDFLIHNFVEIFQFSRSSHKRCSLKKAIPKNFSKFTGKHLCQGLFFNKVAGLRPATSLRKKLWHRCFPVNFTKLIGNFTENLRVTASSSNFFKQSYSFTVVLVQKMWFYFKDFFSKFNSLMTEAVII